MKTWTLSTPERAEKNGEQRTFWHTIAKCRQNDKGFIRIVLPPGIMLDGSAEYFLFPDMREPGDESV